MQVPALLLLILLALGTTDGLPCPSEMNKVKDLLELNCTGLALSAVPSDLPEDMGILLLSANHLTSLSTDTFLSFTQLQDLDLSDNKLVALHTGSQLTSLKELILSYNELKDLPALQALPGLTRLAVAHNSLVALAPEAFRAVPLLQDLDLRGNQLQTLPKEVFGGLEALKELDLSDNLLEELPKELLWGLKRLETLWLSGNRLQTLPAGFFPESHFFMYVFLTENPWHCECNLRYLRAWIRSNEGSVYQPERSLEETKVEVAPEKVLCHSPAEHHGKPVIHFKPNCGNVGDEDEEEEEEYGYGEEMMEKNIMITSHTHPSTPKEPTTMPRAVTWPPLAATRPPSSTPCSSTLISSTSLATSSTSTPSTTTPAPTSPTVAPTPTPSTPASTPRRPTTLVSATSPPTTMSTRPPRASSHPQTALTASAASTHAPRMVATSTFSTASTAVPSAAGLEASSTVRSSSPPLMLTMPTVSTTMLSTPAPTPPGPLDTTRFTQPAPSPPHAPSPPPVPLPHCPCSTPALDVPMLRSRAGGEGPQWGQWVLRNCCLLHWVLYLVSLALLVLTVLALAGWLAWMCLASRTPWHKPLQTQEVREPLLRWRGVTGSPAMHLSSFKSPLRRPTFCTIKEVELCPEVIYCTIKDLGMQHGPPAHSSFCTTKELWVHHSPPSASFKSFSGKLVAADLGPPWTSSAYSLDRGVEAIGEVRVKYAGNTL